MKIRYLMLSFVLGLGLSLGLAWKVRAGGHDDGVEDGKGPAIQLTDQYLFREDWHTNAAGDVGNLILVMNSNPRSLPQQQYYFSSQARYEFHLKRVVDKTVAYSSGEDVILRFNFTDPDVNKQQAITVTAIRDGATTSSQNTSDGTAILTTPLGGTNVNNRVTLADNVLTVFAGLKEDPFFFDEQSFFRVRSSLVSSSGSSLGSGFKPAASAEDTFAGYNVNSIVVRVPITFLQTDTSQTTFDVWETVSVPR